MGADNGVVTAAEGYWEMHPRQAMHAPRSGQPWTDAEYQQILAAAREGVRDIEEVATRIGRAPSPTLAKARRLLPVDERAAPVDRVLPLLRAHQEDPAYHWQRVSLEEPPPRPVIQPPALTGIRGLPPGDLVSVGYAVGLAGAAVMDDDVVTRVGDELQRRGLLAELREYRTERLLRWSGAEITRAEAHAEADDWLERAFPAVRRPDYPWGDVEPARYF